MAKDDSPSSHAAAAGPRSRAKRKRTLDDKTASRLIVGWREWVELPDLGAIRVKAKIDTGARTSAIHAWNIEPYERRGAPWVRFEVHPLQRADKPRFLCEAPVYDERLVKNTSGQAERRIVIMTTLSLAGQSWPIELSLARRDEMGFRLLIGRTALHRRAVVDPSRSFLSLEGVRRIRRRREKD